MKNKTLPNDRKSKYFGLIIEVSASSFIQDTTTDEENAICFIITDRSAYRKPYEGIDIASINDKLGSF